MQWKVCNKTNAWSTHYIFMLFFLPVINLFQRTQDGNLRNNYLNDDKAHKILHSKAVKQSCSREVIPFNIYSRKEKNLKYNVTKIDVSNNQSEKIVWIKQKWAKEWFPPKLVIEKHVLMKLKLKKMHFGQFAFWNAL